MEKADQRGPNSLTEIFPRLVFLGTPDFAVPTLEELAKRGADIALVVTQPDRPKGRGRKPAPSPVKIAAQRLGLSVYQPERIRHPEAVERLLSLDAQCLVLVAYGQLLPKALLEGFPLGALNVHPSLLPKYRGAAPIQRALMNGEEETGVSIMLMDEGMDTGPVLAVQRVPIQPEDTAGTLHDRLAALGAELMCRTLAQWNAGRCRPMAQDDHLACPAPPIQKGEIRVDWGRPAQQVANQIRALDPWPGAYTTHRGKRLKLFRARPSQLNVSGRPGEVLGECEDGLLVAAGDGKAVLIGRLQGEGKRALDAQEFLRGHALPAGDLLQ
ncbi:methionyl-tRNA formyltransferase [Desulfacinum hydrothermale DSM 13146]|uniref:Methionyl-tRNA formyltransferase n=1 Tax=Desulfacinum hydrothermale DSM 13146 TaxID=1121390 RepID=A0A1W1XEY4_9BACT|nr:methionyl-tRNA formyltransferase [Desulfacinum hydrothermale]SMC22372.1 methionyl-tRNA formyltransferase [Desulfacinum hydrothermale DSM 13146]